MHTKKDLFYSLERDPKWKAFTWKWARPAVISAMCMKAGARPEEDK
ncbi:MAG: hypothetical protein LBJ35_08150 [Spirochaetaceae bacterium]|nr:hypothetical protein [Spirochaetaceae bacterium]